MSGEGHSCGPESCWKCGEIHGCICGNDCDKPAADYTPSLDELVVRLEDAISNIDYPGSDSPLWESKAKGLIGEVVTKARADQRKKDAQIADDIRYQYGPGNEVQKRLLLDIATRIREQGATS